ncbi:TnsD family Tn7-like transposition protein [Bacillus pumilus]|uniref:TnsD family Tn7-like transposition protein n=1 Tax=Bacillus pumilus TaxID=1408 RepID=UPI0021B44E0D
MLGVDSKTVKKYLSSEIKIEGLSENDIPSMLLIYRKQLLKGMRQYPSYSRTQIRKCFPKEYMYLYRHDKEWLLEQLPIIQEKKNNQALVDWASRDREYCSKVEKLYKELIELDKPVRITISIIGKRLGILSNLEKHLDKLPQTKKLLSETTESTQQFQIRRCCKIIDRILQRQKPIVLWKVQRIGALKSHHFHEIKPYLEEYLRTKQEVKQYSKQQVKIAWPFAKGEKAQLLWIGEPFRYDYKMMIKVYFCSQGRTEGILMDWGTLPCLAIQHFYTDGILTASKAPKSVEEIDMTIYPNKVKYHERSWSIQGSRDPAPSRMCFLSMERVLFYQSLKYCVAY